MVDDRSVLTFAHVVVIVLPKVRHLPWQIDDESLSGRPRSGRSAARRRSSLKRGSRRARKPPVISDISDGDDLMADNSSEASYCECEARRRTSSVLSAGRVCNIIKSFRCIYMQRTIP